MNLTNSLELHIFIRQPLFDIDIYQKIDNKKEFDNNLKKFLDSYTIASIERTLITKDDQCIPFISYVVINPEEIVTALIKYFADKKGITNLKMSLIHPQESTLQNSFERINFFKGVFELNYDRMTQNIAPDKVSIRSEDIDCILKILIEF
jgi:hypothetical protein